MSSQYIKFIAAISVLFSSYIHADTLTENISVSGFIAAGFVHIDSNEPDEKTRSSAITEGGLNVSATLPRNIEINGQVLYRDVGELSDYSNFKTVNLDYLTLDWHHSSYSNSEQLVSLGRFKSNGGIYSNTRDIPFTRPSIILSSVIYTEESRSISSHIDGIRLGTTHFTETGDYSIEVGYGENKLDDNFISEILQGDNSDKINGENIYFIDMRYQNNNWLLVSTYHNVDIAFAASLSGDSFGFPNFNFDVETKVALKNLLLGAQYLTQNYEITAEFIKQKAETPSIPMLMAFAPNNLTYKSTGYYLQGRYFLSSDISVMVRYEHLDVDFADMPDIPDVSNTSTFVGQESYGASLTWSISENWQATVDYHLNKSGDIDKKTSLFEISWRF